MLLLIGLALFAPKVFLVIFMLNKNTWGVKRCEANQKQQCILLTGMCDQKL